jgi:hypothetical protein
VSQESGLRNYDLVGQLQVRLNKPSETEVGRLWVKGAQLRLVDYQSGKHGASLFLT